MGFFWAVEVKPERADGTPHWRTTSTRSTSKGVVSKKTPRRRSHLLPASTTRTIIDPVLSGTRLGREILSRIAEITDSALTELEKQLGYRS